MDTQSALQPTGVGKVGVCVSGPHCARRTPGGVRLRLGNAQGFATMSFVVAAGFSMLFFVLLANLLVVQYGRAVVRVALDDGVRHGAGFGNDSAQCETRIREVLSGLLSGRMGSGVSYRCVKGATQARATADAIFSAWLPGIPDFRFQMAATATAERE